MGETDKRNNIISYKIIYTLTGAKCWGRKKKKSTVRGIRNAGQCEPGQVAILESAPHWKGGI